MAAIWGDDPSEIAMLEQSLEAARHDSDATATGVIKEKKENVEEKY